MAEAEPLWTTREVAAYLALSIYQVREHVKAGVLPAWRIGNRTLRFDPETIRRLARGAGEEAARGAVSA